MSVPVTNMPLPSGSQANAPTGTANTCRSRVAPLFTETNSTAQRAALSRNSAEEMARYFPSGDHDTGRVPAFRAGRVASTRSPLPSDLATITLLVEGEPSTPRANAISCPSGEKVGTESTSQY